MMKTPTSDTPFTARPPGLQAQRTDLSWTRTSLAFLVNGALLLARPGLGPPGPLHRAAVVIAFVLALTTAVIALRRRRTLSTRPLPSPLAAHSSLLGIGLGTMGLGLMVLVEILSQ